MSLRVNNDTTVKRHQGQALDVVGTGTMKKTLTLYIGVNKDGTYSLIAVRRQQARANGKVQEKYL
jgi:hypothetical protein